MPCGCRLPPGGAAFGLTVLTDHHLGLVRVLPCKFHLAVDLAVGLTFLAAPWLFGFSGLDAVYYWANGAAVVAVIALSAPEADSLPADALRIWDPWRRALWCDPVPDGVRARSPAHWR